ncbi:MAG: cation:proton antiporter, partial [Candidatus Hydrogenedentes bacterium]|nr:cation:proton antiporter [Candidatus Hydrogenedentota bacterium]
RLPDYYIARNISPLLVMIGIVMPLMWIISSAIVWAFIGTSFWVALLIGGILTPTDPVLASSIISGELAEESIPQRIRNIVSAESGANDGLALPFVMLSILFLTKAPAEALSAFLVTVLIWEVGGALAIGLGIGLLAGFLLRRAERLQIPGQVAFLTMGVAMSVFALGFVKWLGGDGILAAFVAGVAFNAVVRSRLESRLEDVQEVASRFFLLPIFVFFGSALPWERWWDLGWRGLALAAAILLLRRIPPLLLLYRGVRPIYNRYDALFVGWFGPIGVAALFYATLALREAHVEMAWVVGSLVICASVLVHGVTATWFTQAYGRAIARQR